MSFFSTAEILKSLISGDLVNSVVSSNEFKVAMGQVDVKKYLSKEVIEQLINNIFYQHRGEKAFEKDDNRNYA